MREIRVGDKVRRIKVDNHIMKIGDIGVVENVEEDAVYIKGEYNLMKYLELVEECEENVEVGEMKKEITTSEKIKELAKECSTFKNGNIKAIIKDKEETIKRYNGIIDDYMKDIRRYSNEIKIKMAEVNGLKEKANSEEDFIDDIRAILEHPLVNDVEIEGECKIVKIYTDYIDIFDERGNRFRGNEYAIKFNYNRMSVSFEGLDEDYCRKSYWTNHDPHPHVDGEGGRPCLGDAGSMLAQTMNDYELYASFIIAINFLQQVNTDDPAGRYICNWDCIDEEDNVIENPHKGDMYECSDCGWVTDDEDEVMECWECGEHYCSDCITWVRSISDYVCNSCLEENYIECDDCGRYHRPSELNETQNEEHVCDDCVNNYYIYCQGCDDLIYERDMHQYKGEEYCKSCYDEKMEEEMEDKE